MKKTTACVAARGKNSDRTYLSGLLLEVLLPSLVALVATSHFIVFFEGDARKVFPNLSLRAGCCSVRGLDLEYSLRALRKLEVWVVSGGSSDKNSALFVSAGQSMAGQITG